MARLTAAQRKKLPSSSFAEPAQRKFPLTDKAHIRSARSYERFASPTAKKKIDAAANKKLGKKK